MKGSFTKRGRQCDVTVTKTHLKCNLKTNFGSSVTLNINLDDILGVQTQSRDQNNASNVVIHYARSKKGKKALSWEKLVLAGSPELCKDLDVVFSDQLSERLRVKHYFVIINPHSGKKTGRRLFHKKVAPLFRACGATFKTYETKGPGDARNALQDVDLTQLDGVIVVGGDGFYSEVMTAMILRQQQAAGINPDDPDCLVSPISCPVGIIPAGTGNYMSLYQHGLIDPIHSAIKIVKGETSPSNLVSIHQGGRIERYSGLLSAFGLIGDIMNTCEKNRWMGNARYKILPIKSIFGRRLISSELEYLSTTDEWHSLKGDFYGVDVNVVNLVDNGEKLVPTFGQEALSLRITSNCPLGHHIKQLSKVAAWAPGAYSFDFVRTENVKKFRLSLNTESTSSAPSTGATSSSAPSTGATSSSAPSTGALSTVPSTGVLSTVPSTGALSTVPSTVVTASSASSTVASSSRSTATTSASRERTRESDYYMNVDGEALTIDSTGFHLSLHSCVVSLFC